MTARRRGDGFQADFMVNGTRFRGQFDTLKAAEIWEEETRLALKKGTPLPSPSPTRSRLDQYATLGAVFDYTVKHVWTGLKAERDLVRNARYCLDHFGTECPVSSIGRVKVDEFILSLKDRRNSGGTINRKLAALSRMLRTAVELGVIQSKPMIPHQREAEGRERYLERQEVDAIVETLRLWSKDDHADLVEFLVATGCRVGEALSLSWGDVKQGTVTVVGEKAKTSKTRHIPIPAAVVAVLERRRLTEARGPFASVTYPSFRHQFERALGHLGLDEDGVVIHTLRHTTASWLAIAGVDIYRIMQFMGHSNVKTTQRYAKLSPNSLDGLADVISIHQERRVA